MDLKGEFDESYKAFTILSQDIDNIVIRLRLFGHDGCSNLLAKQRSNVIEMVGQINIAMSDKKLSRRVSALNAIANDQKFQLWKTLTKDLVEKNSSNRLTHLFAILGDDGEWFFTSEEVVVLAEHVKLENQLRYLGWRLKTQAEDDYMASLWVHRRRVTVAVYATLCVAVGLWVFRALAG